MDRLAQGLWTITALWPDKQGLRDHWPFPGTLAGELPEEKLLFLLFIDIDPNSKPI